MSEIKLDVDTAIPIGLITNELITNSLKHAFPTEQNGKISITLSQGKTDGLKITRIIRENYQISVVFLSANTNKEIFKEVIDIQPYAFITKPFDNDDLKRGIETTFKRMIAEGLWAKDTYQS